MTDPASTHALHSKRARSRSRRRTGRKNLKFRFGLKVESLRRVAGRYRLRRRLSRSKASASAGWRAVVGRPRQAGRREKAVPSRKVSRHRQLVALARFLGRGRGEGAREPAHVDLYAEKVAFARLLTRRRGKARDFASLASPASLIAPNRCQQTVCIGDAKCGTARGSRHGFCVRVTRSSRCVDRAVFRD